MIGRPDTEPACWSWPVTSREHEGLFRAGQARCPDDAGVLVVQEWQAGRCAACGWDRDNLEADHSHDTGYFRGLLCRSCNVREAHARPDDPVFSRYRARPPAVILGVTVLWAPPDSRRYYVEQMGGEEAVARMLQEHMEATDPLRGLSDSEADRMLGLA